jgi:GT2 family glycosyltransferase
MTPPKISLIFPTYLRPEEVIWNLNFFRENISVPYEVFILDNSPQEMTYNFQENEHYIFLNENIGTASRNIGIQKANAPICLLLDDDSHPELGAIEKIIEEVTQLDDTCLGLITEIHNPDGNREASLLPTVFHGAGVAFKTAAMRNNKLYYPENYCFYGEEYRLSLEIYAKGFHLKSSTAKIIHRRSPSGRNLEKIFYYLGRNNKIIWQDLVPEKYLRDVLYDSQRRYELTSQKENTEESLTQGLQEQLSTDKRTPMTEAHFEEFSLINKFNEIPAAEKFILCGTGKFTSLWAKLLSTKCSELIIADFNTAFHNQNYGAYNICSPENCLKSNGTFLIGHSSSIDTENWAQLLQKNNIDFYDLRDRQLQSI